MNVILKSVAASDSVKSPTSPQVLLKMAAVLDLWPTSTSSKIGVLAIIGCIIFLLGSYFNKGLNRFPGHWVASFSQIWLLLDTRRGQHHSTIVKLHEKYGNIVRLGPNSLSLADPADIKIIYGFAKRLNKSQFYAPFTPYGVKSNVFAEIDDRIHDSMKKPLVGAYSMTSLKNYEPYIDEQIKVFLTRLEELFGAPGTPCEMDKWFQYCARLSIFFSSTRTIMTWLQMLLT